MVCAKCQRKMKKTELATPGVKHRSEMYYGSPSATIGGGGDPRAKSGNKAQQGDRAGSSTLGNTGVSKNKLLSSKAKNPYAAYAASCETCKTRIEQGRKFCQSCAYQRNACPMCGKSLVASSKKDQPVVQGQKFTLK